MAEVKSLIVNGVSRFNNTTYSGLAYADAFVTNGGTHTQFVKGDGTLDSTTYVDGGYGFINGVKIGNIAVAYQLGTVDKGSASLPIYLDDGVPKTITSLNVSSGAITGGTITGSSLVSNGNLTVKGNTTLGDATTDTTTISGSASVGTTLNVSGNTTLGTNSSNTTTINGALVANNNATVNGNLTANGNVTLGNEATDAITINGATTVDNTLEVNGATDLNSTLDVSGDTAITGKLGVLDNVTFENNALVKGYLTLSNDPVENKHAATKQYVDTQIGNLPSPMVFKGTLGTGGTITALPTVAASNTGWTYKVITAGTYASQSAKSGDVFVSNGSTWILIPSGDDIEDTWRNIKVNGTEVLGSGISSGALNLKGSTYITVSGAANSSDVTFSSKNVVTSIGVSNDKLTWAKDGTAQTALTIPYATTALNLTNKPVLAASGTTQITVKAGEKTSDPFTVPYATLSQAQNVTAFTSGQDLNDFKTAGAYGSTGTSTNTSLLNKPTGCYSGETRLDVINTANGTTNYIFQRYWTRSSNNFAVYERTYSGSAWSSWVKTINSGNYTEYTVKKDGTGATGVWPISVTGNAATATLATTADNLSTNPELITGTTNAATHETGIKVKAGNKTSDPQYIVPFAEEAHKMVPLKTKLYDDTSFIGTGENWPSTTRYFMSVKPNSASDYWHVKYKIRIWIPNDTSKRSTTSIVEYFGYGISMKAYKVWNTVGPTYATYYHTVYWLNATGLANGYGHAIGESILYAANYTTASWYRHVQVDLLEYSGCDVTLFDSLLKWENCEGYGLANDDPNNPNKQTNYAQNLNAQWTVNSTSQGLQESGDSDNVTSTQLYYTRIKAGTNGIMHHSLVMEDSNGAWQSFTTTAGTGVSKTKNTAGFRLGSKVYYMSISSNVTAGNYVGHGAVYENVAIPDFRYDLNINTTSGHANNLLPRKPLYIVGTIGTTDGLFYLDDVWWTQDEPTSDNGKVYIKVCDGVYADYENDRCYRGDLISDAVPMWFKNGLFRPYPEGQPTLSTTGNQIVVNTNNMTSNALTVPYATNAGDASTVSGYNVLGHYNLLYKNANEVTFNTADMTEDFWYVKITFKNSWSSIVKEKICLIADYSNHNTTAELQIFGAVNCGYSYKAHSYQANDLIVGICSVYTSGKQIIWLKLKKPWEYENVVPNGKLHVYSSYVDTITAYATADLPSGKTFDSTLNQDGQHIFSASLKANSFIKRGGTSSQFLKADGSVDSTVYATAASLGNYLPLAGGTMTGAIRRDYDAASDVPVLNVQSANQNVWLWRVKDKGTGTATSISGVYGFGLKYLGGGSGNDNSLALYADNQSGTQIKAFEMKQSGNMFAYAPIHWTSDSLPANSSPLYFLTIDAFASGGKTKYASKDNVITALGLGSYVTLATNQTITGQKTFNTDINAKPVIISRSNSAAEALKIGVNDTQAIFEHVQDELVSDFIFKGTYTGTEGSQQALAGSKQIRFALSSSDHNIYVGSNKVLHKGTTYVTGGVGTIDNDTITNVTNSTYAVQLASAKTIWGQSFNGTNNVSGDMTGVGTINGLLDPNGAQQAAKLNIREIVTTVNCMHAYVASTNGTNLNTRPLILQNGYGNVGIGETTAPQYKLTVVGSFNATSIYHNGTILSTAATHAHGDYVTAIGVSGNTLTWSKGGTAQTALTIPFATNSTNATNASKVTVTDSNTSSDYRMVFHNSTSLYSTADVTCNPSTDELDAKILRAKSNDIYAGSASGSQCHLQYDNTIECLKIMFD